MRHTITLAACLFAGTAFGIGPAPESTLTGAPAGGAGQGLTAGDVNGDGYDDLVFGDSRYSNGETNEGAALVYLGGPGGIPSATVGDADAVFESGDAFDGIGARLASGGDVNGDGYDDVLISNINFVPSSPPFRVGAVYVWLGSASGLVSGGPGVAATTLLPGPGSGAFGSRVEFAGDVNGDGYDDVLLGDFGHSQSLTTQGAVTIYHGSAGGISSSATPDTTLLGASNGSFFGRSLGPVGDVNGDGYDDILVGDTSGAYVFLGSATGIPSGGPALAHATFPGTVRWGQPDAGDVAGGDIDADGYSDVAIRALGPATGATIAVFHGSASGLPSASLYEPELEIRPDSFEYIPGERAEFGIGRIGFGDLNGDGFADLVVSDAEFDLDSLAVPEPDEGMVAVLLGGAVGLLPDQPGRVVRLVGLFPPLGVVHRFGSSMHAAGDFDADGRDDLAASEAPGWVYVHTFHGTAVELVPTLAPIGAGSLVGALLVVGAWSLARSAPKKEKRPAGFPAGRCKRRSDGG